MESAIGLVITGGGARGSYQAGVLKRIGEIKRVQERGNPFPIIGGASAGAVNGAALAVGADDFASTTMALADLWARLRPSDIFHCDLASQAQFLDVDPRSFFWRNFRWRQCAIFAGCDSFEELPQPASRLRPNPGKHQAR